MPPFFLLLPQTCSNCNTGSNRHYVVAHLKAILTRGAEVAFSCSRCGHCWTATPEERERISCMIEELIRHHEIGTTGERAAG